MYSAKPHRDAQGKVLSGQYVSKETQPGAGRIQPDRRWFGNTRVVGQKELETFRDELQEANDNPYKVVLGQKKLPWTLLKDPEKERRPHIVGVEPFEATFGKKATRKKPKLAVFDYEALAKHAEEKESNYEVEKDTNFVKGEYYRKENPDPLFQKGQSKRIWGELYKVIDSSDVVIQVLDARDPMGTRSASVEKHLREKCPTKHLVFVLNKCDLIPTWATARWVKVLSTVAPTLAMHAHITKAFGKGNLINLLRQFAQLHMDKKQVSVGFIGYPNVGKSSVINALKSKKVCKTAPIPGETKVWQYITLFKRVYLIDCPGVVPATGDTETDIVLKGVTRVTDLASPSTYVEGLLNRAKKEHVARTYGIREWEDTEDFLTKLAKKQGRLIKHGEADIETVARGVLFDWQKGKLPYFVAPPFEDGMDTKPKEIVVDDKTLILENQKFADLEVDPIMAMEAEKEYLGKGKMGQLKEEEYFDADEIDELEDEEEENDEDEEGNNNYNEDEEDEEEEEDEFEQLITAVKKRKSRK